MRNIEKAIEAYKVKHDSRSDLSVKETYYFIDRFNEGGGSVEEKIFTLIYDVFRFAYWFGYQAGRRARKGK